MVEEEALALLGRSPLGFPQEALGVATGRRVVITGAGGFIGSALAQMIATVAPASLVLIDNGEHGLYSIDRAIAQGWPELPRRTILCDIRDAAAITRHLVDTRAELIFNAAALKQVPMLEDNAREAALTNVIGARNVAEAGHAAGATIVIQVSTDKAVHPISVLGKTKRLAERLYQALDAQSSTTRFVAVRFGKVLGSSGSVVPLFREQIAAGGPVTLTSRGVTRYFMTTGEAAKLLLQVAHLAGKESARGLLYLLATGDPLPIEELAQRMIERYSGGRAVPVGEVGLRPGERRLEWLVRED